MIIDDEHGRPHIIFLHNQARRSNKPTATMSSTVVINGIQYQRFSLRCDLHARAVQLMHDIQQASAFFEEENFRYISLDDNDDDDDDDDDDISDEQQINESTLRT